VGSLKPVLGLIRLSLCQHESVGVVDDHRVKAQWHLLQITDLLCAGQIVNPKLCFGSNSALLDPDLD
jgi:hypothetical protein